MSTIENEKINPEQNAEVVEEEEAVDVELQEKMRNVKLDDNCFAENKPKANADNSKSNKNNKNKKKKGEDFLTYANKNGIQLNLEYEDKSNKPSWASKEASFQKKPYVQAPKERLLVPEPNQTSYTPKVAEGTKTEKPYKSNNNYKKNKPKYQANNNNSNNYQKVSGNKFDLVNGHLNKMMSMGAPFYNPYYNMQNPYQATPFAQPLVSNQPDLIDDSEKSILNFLESYVSLDNLNKDLYLRNRIDENGFIEISEIANYNKLKSRGISADKLAAILINNAENTFIETIQSNGGIFIRNREFETLKDKLFPIEMIQQQKRLIKQQYQQQFPVNNMNYVSLQNNYFFNSMPGQQDPNMMGGYVNQYMQYPAYAQPQPDLIQRPDQN